MREKLIELLNNSFDKQYSRRGLLTAPHTADDLIANGVVVLPLGGIGEMSDGYHTFNELYHHRAMLFSVICNARPDLAWKSKLHDTGDPVYEKKPAKKGFVRVLATYRECKTIVGNVYTEQEFEKYITSL